MSDLNVGSASPPTADVPTCGSRLTLSPNDPFPTFQECGEPAGHRGPHNGAGCSWTAVDHSGVAGEPEATTKEASEIDSPGLRTQHPVPEGVRPAAADVAGGVMVSDEAVEAYRSAWARSFREEDRTDVADIRAGLAAAAPLIAAQAIAETQEVAAELATEREWVQRAAKVLRYVSAGRRFVDVEPYPDAAARKLLGELDWSAGMPGGVCTCDAVTDVDEPDPSCVAAPCVIARRERRRD